MYEINIKKLEFVVKTYLKKIYINELEIIDVYFDFKRTKFLSAKFLNTPYQR